MRRLARLALTLAAAALASAPALGADWIMRMNQSEAAYQEFYDFDLPDGFRPIAVDIQDTDSDQNLGAIWIDDGNDYPWIAHHNMTSAEYQAKVEEYAGDGYRPIAVDAAGNYPNERYTAAWVNDGTPLADWVAAHRRTQDEIEDLNVSMLQSGFRPVCIAGHGYASSPRFIGIWERNPKSWRYTMTVGLDESAYQAVVEIRARDGWRMTHMTAYGNSENRRLGAVWVRTDGDDFVRQFDSFARHGQTYGEFQDTMNGQFGSGFHPVSAVSYSATGNPRFGQVWVKEVPDSEWRETGAFQGGLIQFDLAMRDYMTARQIQRGALAITKDKRLVYNRAFTFDHPGAWDTQPWHRFRVASVSKPITAVAVLQAVEMGLFELDDTLGEIPGFDTSGWLNGTVPDQVTIDMLLKHLGGWDRALDPMLDDFDIADELGVELPIGFGNIFDATKDQPLAFTPGTDYEYSNFGYALLGHVIELTSGQTYEDFVREHVLCPLGAQTMVQANTQAEYAHPDEVNYLQPFRELDYDAMGGGWLVPTPYGEYNVGNMDAHGGWVATAEELARFVSDLTEETTSELCTQAEIDYMFTATPLNDSYGAGWQIRSSYVVHNGALPGTWAYIIRMENGVTISALFNADPRYANTPVDDDAGDIRGTLVSIANSIGDDGTSFWPLNDLFAPVSCASLAGDLDGDGEVGSGDLGILLAEWGQRSRPSDLDGDGITGSGDLGILLASWGG